MRVSTLTSFVLATVVAADKATYLKSSDGEYYLGSYTTDDAGDQGLFAFYSKFSPGTTTAVGINSDTTLTFNGVGLNFYLDQYVPGPDGLYGEIYAYEQVRDDNGATGFSWGKNGTLEFDNDQFHGWVHCKGGNYTTADGSTAFYWSSSPITTLPDECNQVELLKYEH